MNFHGKDFILNLLMRSRGPGYFFLLRSATSPTSPVPSSQAAAGMGTAETLTLLSPMIWSGLSPAALSSTQRRFKVAPAPHVVYRSIKVLGVVYV